MENGGRLLFLGRRMWRMVVDYCLLLRDVNNDGRLLL